MEIKGLTVYEWRSIVDNVSSRLYDNNVTVTGHEYNRGNGISRATLRVASSRGPGARRGFSGRRTTSACWHAFRDVLVELFERYPYAKVRTAIAIYDGKAGFYRNYPATADINVGSQVQPRTMPEMCECDGNIPMSPAEVTAEFEGTITGRLSTSEPRYNFAHPQTQAIDDEFGWGDSARNRGDYRSDKEMLGLK